MQYEKTYSIHKTKSIQSLQRTLEINKKYTDNSIEKWGRALTYFKKKISRANKYIKKYLISLVIKKNANSDSITYHYPLEDKNGERLKISNVVKI